MRDLLCGLIAVVVIWFFSKLLFLIKRKLLKIALGENS